MLLNPIDSWGYYGHSVEGRNALLTHLLRMLSGAAHLSFPLTFVLAVAGAVIDHRKQRELDDCAVVGRSNSVQSIATCDDSVSSSEEMPLMIHLVIALWVLMRPILVVPGLAYAIYSMQ